MIYHFSGTTIFTFFNNFYIFLVAFSKRLALYLKDAELSKATFKRFPASFIGDSSLLN